jgi:hypothetical protein
MLFGDRLGWGGRRWLSAKPSEARLSDMELSRARLSRGVHSDIEQRKARPGEVRARLGGGTGHAGQVEPVHKEGSGVG